MKINQSEPTLAEARRSIEPPREIEREKKKKKNTMQKHG